MAAVALAALTVVLVPGFFSRLSAQSHGLLTLAAILLMALVIVILLLATSVYRQNTLVVTDKGIVQTLQAGPFARKTSRLSMADVEDVSADQKGILPSVFNYGTLVVETSAELKNFEFKYCPDPSQVANQVGQARQNFVQSNKTE